MFFSETALASLQKSRFFRKKYFQEQTTSDPRKSHFGPPKILLDSRGPGTPGWEPLLYGDLLLAA